MSLIQIVTIITGILTTPFVLATPPVEVFASCKNLAPVNSSIKMTKLFAPDGLGDDEPKCMDHFESTLNNLNYGYITCNDETSLIVKGSRINLKTSINHSINPSITPGGDISALSYWWKIEFNNIGYLCIDTPLSSSGDGANVFQYYIVENAFNSDKPIIHFYFLNKDIMPMASTN
jgi:hypothetical protein